MSARQPARRLTGDAGQYVQALGHAFGQAAAASSISRYYRIGAHRLHLRLAGEALRVPLTAALAHLECAPVARPSLQVDCWDSASTGIALPDPPWPPLQSSGEPVAFYEGGAFRLLHQPAMGALNAYDIARRHGFYWMAHAGALRLWEESFPLRTMLHWWSADRPLQPVHAAAIGTDAGGVLLAGKGGSGKSTAALACLGSSLRYAGDDYVLAAMQPKPYAYSLYNSAKLSAHSLELLPEWKAHTGDGQVWVNGKALLFLHSLAPHFLCAGFPIRAILLPRITGDSDTRLRRASASQALLALAPSTVLQLRGDSGRAFAKISALAQSLPCYWLEMGTRMERIPAVIADYLERGDDD